MKRRRQGIWIEEVVMGLAILVALAAALTAAARAHSRGLQYLSDQRNAARVAETVLTSLQAGRELPSQVEGVVYQVNDLKGAANVENLKWVEVNVRVDRTTANLIGLAPAPKEKP